MNEMTQPSRHRMRNSSPGGLRSSTLPLGHRGSPQYWSMTTQHWARAGQCWAHGPIIAPPLAQWSLHCGPWWPHFFTGPASADPIPPPPPATKRTPCPVISPAIRLLVGCHFFLKSTGDWRGSRISDISSDSRQKLPNYRVRALLSVTKEVVKIMANSTWP